jgi:Tol biopolymer transport system component
MAPPKSAAITAFSLSPDGKWMAYQSNESKRPEVYVQTFPPSGQKYQISTNGGLQPLWAPDGKQLFFLVDPSFEGFGRARIAATDIRTEPSFVIGKARPLPVEILISNNPEAPRTYDITPDGKYFVVMSTANFHDADRRFQIKINLVLNWFEELKQRVPVH